jgi:hypothetical protein
MVSHRSCIALTWAAWLPATVALATQEPAKVVMKPAPTEAAEPTQVAPVTVESTRPEELRKQTYNFVQVYAATTQNLEQIARWDVPVCVSVQGLPADAAALVKGRVEEVAKALKVRVQMAGCGPNIQVFFTDQPQPLMDRIAVEHERFLGYWHHRDRNKLKVVTHPIQSWYVTATGGSGGNTVGMEFMVIEEGNPQTYSAPTTVAGGGVAGHQQGGETYDDEFTNRTTTGCADRPHFTSCLSSGLRNVLVVVDTRNAQGASSGAVADYVTMLAMAQPKSLDGCNTLPSVIDLFASRCPGGVPDGFTRADVAYLTSLYKTNPEAKKAGQETDIAGRMADMLLKANAADRVAAWGGTAVKASTGK